MPLREKDAKKRGVSDKRSRLAVAVDPETRAALDAIASERGVKLSDVVRGALQREIDSPALERPEPMSDAELEAAVSMLAAEGDLPAQRLLAQMRGLIGPKRVAAAAAAGAGAPPGSGSKFDELAARRGG